MKSSPNHRRWIMPVAWLVSAAAAFSIGRMSSWLEEPVVPQPTAGATSGAGAGSATSTGSSFSENRDRLGVSSSAVGGENRPVLSIGEVTGGQPLEDWLKKLMAQDDDIYRMQNFIRLFDSLNSVEDVKAALQVIAPAGRGRGMRFAEYGMLLQKLTQISPKDAIAYASEANGGERWMATGTVLRNWTKSEPEAALAWAKENGIQQNPEGNDGGRGEDRNNDNWALASVVTQLAKTNLDKALSEAMTTELGRGSGRTADALATEAIEQRGVEQAKTLATSLPAGQFRDEFIQQMADRLANSDPQGTAQWVAGLESGEAKRRAMSEAVDEWYRKDAAGAIGFVNSLPVSPDNDSARQRIAGEVVRTDQAQALKAISGISDPERQVRAVVDTSRSLARQDVAAAQNFVAQTPIADETKAQIAQQLAQPQRGGDFGGRRPGGFGGPGGGGGRPGGPAGGR